MSKQATLDGHILDLQKIEYTENQIKYTNMRTGQLQLAIRILGNMSVIEAKKEIARLAIRKKQLEKDLQELKIPF